MKSPRFPRKKTKTTCQAALRAASSSASFFASSERTKLTWQGDLRMSQGLIYGHW
jgi:hypothetical protein